jgi:hypothetical protein
MMKPRLDPPLEKNPVVGIRMDGMGMIMLGRLVDGKKDTTSVPQIEGPIEMGIDGVGPMVLKDGNVYITRIPLVPLIYGLDVLATLEKHLGSTWCEGR